MFWTSRTAASSLTAGHWDLVKVVIILYYHVFYLPLKMRITWLLARPHGCLLAALMTGFRKS